jgi:hypothetical protein
LGITADMSPAAIADRGSADHGATVLLPAVEHFRNRRLFVSHEDMAVFALGNTEDTRGYLTSVCKSPKCPGSMTQLLQLAIQKGANQLFCLLALQ